MLDKKYDHLMVEKDKYENWKNKGYFTSDDMSKEPFCIVIPPPNVTGKLHLGHAWDTSIQDMIIRYKKMCGFDAIWVPGMDHAGIATQAKIDKKLKSEGIDPRSMDREEWLKVAWEWKEEYAENIHQQWSKLGLALDYSKERFTLDEGLSNAVKKVFVDLYNKGLIYRGERIINWDPQARTALSTEEVIYKDTPGAFYHIKYMVEGSNSEYLEVATTRPETLFGDTAVAVNPEDERYKKYIGKNVILPVLGKKIPVVADAHADMEFGTGVVKITPAHDPNDFEVGNRHNLERIIVINPDGTMNDNAGKYNGLDRFECREKLVKDLEEEGLLLEIEEINHNVGYSERTDVMIEPYLSKQWFVKMRPLADRVLENQKNKDTKVNFVPSRYEKIMNHWMEITYDWCISRQLWWGHRIPAWYCDDCGEMIVSVEKPGVCPKCGKDHWTQDPDTLDTWFSSALWPFSTLGWPEKTEDLDYFYPNDVLVTGYDIIFFWVIRMIFSGYEQMGKAPFHTVLFHGLVRDSQGRKMSKSLGNGIDPLEVIDKYGADALRLTLITGNAPGNDMRFYWERVEASRNFANKVWNASRFIMMNLDGVDVTEPKAEDLHTADKWILSRVNTLAKDATENMDKFELGIAVQKVYDFIWDEFCDWYIEIAKVRTYKKDEDPASANAALWTLKTVLVNALKLLHPYMPFITEEIFCTLQSEEETIMLSKWPEYKDEWNFPEDEDAISHIKDLVKGIRNVRTEMDVPPSRKAKLFVVSEDENIRNIFENNKEVYVNLAFTSEIAVAADKAGIGEDAVSVVIPGAVCYLPLEDLVDFEKEKERLNKEKEKLTKELARSRGMLSNEKFLNNAKPEKVEEEKAKLAKYEQMMEQVEQRLASMK